MATETQNTQCGQTFCFICSTCEYANACDKIRVSYKFLAPFYRTKLHHANALIGDGKRSLRQSSIKSQG